MYAAAEVTYWLRNIHLFFTGLTSISLVRLEVILQLIWSDLCWCALCRSCPRSTLRGRRLLMRHW